MFSVLEGYGIGDEEAVHATRALRASLHGFASLEAAGGFGMPQSVDGSFARMVEGLDAMLAGWSKLTVPDTRTRVRGGRLKDRTR